MTSLCLFSMYTTAYRTGRGVARSFFHGYNSHAAGLAGTPTTGSCLNAAQASAMRGSSEGGQWPVINLSGGASRFLKRDIVWHEQKTKNAKITIRCHHMMDIAQLTECKRGTVGKREFLIMPGIGNP